ncbi:MAG TPA: thioredoxin family protein, partial [Acidimicrobiales bacterium]|nr:thioredoxin family protein [Acidimicrobiales bacterium]
AKLLTKQVRIRLFTEPATGLYVPGRPTCETCADAEALMNEVADLSDRIYLEIVDVSAHPDLAREAGVALIPTMAVDDGADSGVRFVGLPDGYEFSSFVETLVAAGSEAGHGLSDESLARLESLTTEVEIKTFVTPT